MRELGESGWDALGPFSQFSAVSESLRDSKIQPMSDWGSSGRRFKLSARPEFLQFKAVLEDSEAVCPHTCRGYVAQRRS
jgi:hypothetical protein